MKRIKINVSLDVTVSQGLALQSFFEYWDALGKMGSSRTVGFFVDGDGDFHPNVKITFSENIPDLNDELRKLSVITDDGGNKTFDYDGIGWKLDEYKLENKIKGF